MMSVTFWCPAAPRSSGFEITSAGFSMHSELPEVNLANANARACLNVMGLDSNDLQGLIPLHKLPDIMTRLDKAIALSKGESGAEAHLSAFHDDVPYLLGILERLYNLFSVATYNEFDVMYC